MIFPGVNEVDVEKVYQILGREAKEGGYNLNPDAEFKKNLVRGLLRNEQRYGYPTCPYRLASGRKEEDLDIVCPCDYRDPDLVGSVRAITPFMSMTASHMVIRNQNRSPNAGRHDQPWAERMQSGQIRQAAWLLPCPARYGAARCAGTSVPAMNRRKPARYVR